MKIVHVFNSILLRQITQSANTYNYKKPADEIYEDSDESESNEWFGLFGLSYCIFEWIFMWNY